MAPRPKKYGYVFVDHRASPGLAPAVARSLGLDPRMLGEGSNFETATITCAHCGAVVIKNLNRTRPRGECAKCARYLCDPCALVTQQPGYVHRSFRELSDLITSGRFTVTGPASNPTLIPVAPTP